MIRRSYTAVVERNRIWRGHFETEPYEAGWATEAILFVRTLESSGLITQAKARIQISPDGMHWCDEGNSIPLVPEPGVTFCRVNHFGGYLRIAGDLPAGEELKVMVYISLKE